MTRRLVVLFSAILLLVAGCSSSGGAPSPKASELQGGAGGRQFDGFGLSTPQPRPSFTLTDTAGKPFAFGSTTSGHPTLLFFGYTNCPDVCPTTMADVGQALRTLPADIAKQTYVVFVTTDIKRDTPPVLARWLQNFSPGTRAHFVGLTGTQAEIDAAQASAHVMLAEDGGQQHSATLLLFGSDDYARVSYGQSTNLAAQVEHDLPVVAKG